jgi:hypothetical protein
VLTKTLNTAIVNKRFTTLVFLEHVVRHLHYEQFEGEMNVKRKTALDTNSHTSRGSCKWIGSGP